MLEDEVSQLIQMEAPKLGVTLFRNNSGCFTDATGRQVRFGLGNVSKKISDHFKSSDLIGITEVRITPSMVGTKMGIFTAVEVKREGWNPKNLDARETAQKAFIEFIQNKQGIAGFCNSVEQFKNLIFIG